MIKGLWGSLLLSLGWVSGLAAQEDTWRPAADSLSAPTPAGVQEEAAPGVDLDRPVAVMPPPLAAPPALEARATPPLIIPTGFTLEEAPAAPAPLPPALARPQPALVVIATSANVPAPPPTTLPPTGSFEASEFAATRAVFEPPEVPGGVLVAQAIAPPGGVPVFPEGPAGPAAAPDAPPGYNPWAPAPVGGANPWPADPEGFAFPPAGGWVNPCFYITGEYLMWWTKGENTPVLLTTSSPSDFGILGNPSTQILYGGDTINNQMRSGARINAGWWLNDEHTWAIDAGFFFLGTQTSDFSANSAQYPVLGRPFLNVNTNQQFSELVALPGVAMGTATIHTPSTLWGFDTNLRYQLCCGCNWSVNGLIGFRYLYLGESIDFTENIQGEPTAPAPFTNESILVYDRFATFNQFYGGQVGLDGRYRYGRWTLDLRGKLALGSTVQTLDISGFQHFMSPTGAVSAVQGGLLALPGANIGQFRRSAFSVVPEVGTTIGYQLTPHLRGFLGYNLLYWTNVIRPGDQIDPRLNVDKIPNFPTNSPASPLNLPSVPFRESSFWAQGFIVGLELTF
jgi:hypothetical protein